MTYARAETRATDAAYVPLTRSPTQNMKKFFCLIIGAVAPFSIAAAQAPALTAVLAVPGASDTVSVATLSLADAVTIARRNNPAHLSVVNNRGSADAAIRTAYGQLLPNADASFNAQRQQGGRQIFNGGSFGANSDVNQSSYRVGLGYTINTATLITPRLQRANRDAVSSRR